MAAAAVALGPSQGLPASLNNCVLWLPGDEGYLHFLQPSATVESQGLVASFQYHPRGPDAARVEVVPQGGALGSGFCTVRHELELQKATVDERSVRYAVRDTGSLQPCSTVAGRILSPVVSAATEATLVCPRERQPWFHR